MPACTLTEFASLEPRSWLSLRKAMDLAHLVKNNIYVYGIRGEGRSATRRAMALMAEKRFDATKIHTHTFPLADLPTALRYARERIEGAIKVVVTNQQGNVIASAAAE